MHANAGLPGAPDGFLQTPQSFDAFARFYDDDYRDYFDDLGLILGLAEEQGSPVLELGVGTGRVLLPLVDAGHTVTGVDLSPALLTVARHKLQGAEYEARATLIEADLLAVELPRDHFALAVCTSNTFMHLADADAQLALLQRALAWLQPGGLLLIDLFNPDLRRLFDVNGLTELADTWTSAEGTPVIKWSVREVDVELQLQQTTFIYEEQAADGSCRRTVCSFPLRWIWRNEGELMLRLAGFEVEEVWGDLEGGAYDTGSEHLVFLARKPAGGPG